MWIWFFHPPHSPTPTGSQNTGPSGTLRSLVGRVGSTVSAVMTHLSPVWVTMWVAWWVTRRGHQGRQTWPEALRTCEVSESRTSIPGA